MRAIFSFPTLPASTLSHLEAYNRANWISLAVVPLFYIATAFLIGRFKNTANFLALAQVVVTLFSLMILVSGMRASFFSMHNPRNTMLMYMVGVIIVGAFFAFEYYETIVITLITGLLFSFILPFYQHTIDELIINNLASLVLLTVFFCLSRFLFSYRADNFNKLKAIEQKNNEIEHASQMKNDILGIVAHDLRNPLTAIKFAATLMEPETLEDSEHREFIQMIKTSCDKATSIINDLLVMSHIEVEGEFELEKTEMDEFLLLIIGEWLKNKEQVNILYNSTKHPTYALINREKMQRALDNLISNAIKFSGKIDKIEITLKDDEGAIAIGIKDYGIGIPKDLLPHIFDRFSKASRKGTRGEPSVGLGLSIVKQIVSKHKGEIEVNSAEDKGTTFTIKVPAA